MLRFILPSIAWTTFVITMSLLPSTNVELTGLRFEGADKVTHFIMYALLSLFWSTGLKKQNKSIGLRDWAFEICVYGGFFLGFILEVLQEFYTDTRHFELTDLLANGIGCIFGVLMFRLIYPNYKR